MTDKKGGEKLLSLNEAAQWATKYLEKPVTKSNISYLVQYAKVKKYKKENTVRVNFEELKEYYDENIIKKHKAWKQKLGKDLNWALSFDYLREVDTTKHVHRLHPYKGKFIPQLVEYFLDNKTNKFKTEVFFKKGDIILDPFMGSGTTLLQASELGMHSIGIDISGFNCLISKVKSEKYDVSELKIILDNNFKNIASFSKELSQDNLNELLKEKIAGFNNQYFPNPIFKQKIKDGKIKEFEYAEKMLNKFVMDNEKILFKINNNCINKNEIDGVFLSKWYSNEIKQELSFYLNLINNINDKNLKNLMKLILSRTARSCRATTHFDLATLKEPQQGPYYCRKHKKICVPIHSIIKHLKKNGNDALKRIEEFSKLRKYKHLAIIHGDSRDVNIFEEVKKQEVGFYNYLIKNKISGIFTSPPYVGQIDYHEQHAYAYELFDIPRLDEKEIGPLYKGQGKQAREEYVEGISEVLLNASQFVKDDGDFFIVANDKYNLYPRIAKKSNLKIVNQFKRPVLNRTERDRQPYSEIIFHMKKI